MVYNWDIIFQNHELVILVRPLPVFFSLLSSSYRLIVIKTITYFVWPNERISRKSKKKKNNVSIIYHGAFKIEKPDPVSYLLVQDSQLRSNYGQKRGKTVKNIMTFAKSHTNLLSCDFHLIHYLPDYNVL